MGHLRVQLSQRTQGPCRHCCLPGALCSLHVNSIPKLVLLPEQRGARHLCWRRTFCSRRQRRGTCTSARCRPILRNGVKMASWLFKNKTGRKEPPSATAGVSAVHPCFLAYVVPSSLEPGILKAITLFWNNPGSQERMQEGGIESDLLIVDRGHLQCGWAQCHLGRVKHTPRSLLRNRTFIVKEGGLDLQKGGGEWKIVLT